MSIVSPTQVSLKHTHIHHTDGVRDVAQRRLYRGEEWDLESIPDYLARVAAEAKRLETTGKNVHHIYTSSRKSTGNELVEITVPDLLNRFCVLDYLAALLLKDVEVDVTDGTITINVPSDVIKEAWEHGMPTDCLSTPWAPSTDPVQAMYLQIVEGLSSRHNKGSWEVSYNDAHKQALNNTHLTLEILRTTIRKNYHEKAILMPTKAFVQLGDLKIEAGQRGFTPESF